MNGPVLRQIANIACSHVAKRICLILFSAHFFIIYIVCLRLSYIESEH